MSKLIKLNKGLDIRLAGAADKTFETAEKAMSYAMKPTDFIGLTPKVVVKVGDPVKAGSPLFFDKNQPQVKFVSPVSGTISAINRGEKRKLLSVSITPDETQDYIKHDINELAEMTRDQVLSILLESGAFPVFIQRPYGIVANPNDIPKSIFISCFDSAPLAIDYDIALADEMNYFEKGLDVLAKLTEGSINLGISAGQKQSKFAQITKPKVVQTSFSGPHPAGNVGIQINHVDPINKGDIVWTIKPQHVVLLGKLFTHGVYDATTVVAFVGSRVKKPCYYKLITGASVSMFANKFDNTEETRMISGSVLSGTKLTDDDYISFYDSQVCVIPEGDYFEMFGWAKPFRSKKFSASHAYFSWLTPKKKFDLDTNYNGSPRAFVMNGQYDKVLPMDIFPVYLLKAILAADIDKMEQLGIYEVIEEDMALCEFVCTSKIEVQEILREGITIMIKEMS